MEKLEKDIIALVTEDSRRTPAKMAVMLGVTEAKVQETLKSLEARGIIVKYGAIVNSDIVEDDSVEALIEVKVTPQRGTGFDRIAEEIAAYPQVKTLYLMSGAYDLAVIVHSTSLKEVSRFISECISTYDNVLSTATHFILKKYKVEGANMTEMDSTGGRLNYQP